MANIAYVNGRYVDKRTAAVNIEDRGYQFSDGIYEYIAFYNRRFLDADLHLARLERSLEKIAIPMPMSRASMQIVMHEMLARNGREHGGFYIQVTRGVARRDHVFPAHAKPALVMTIGAAKFPKPQEMADGVTVITHADERWARCDIKSVSLLANVLAKQAASSQKAREAWLVGEDGHITEGAVSNAYIVSRAGELITHPKNEHILGGITRDVVLSLARANNIPVAQRPFSLAEAKAATEAFITSTSINVLPVVTLDKHTIGEGKPGPVTRKLKQLYEVHILAQTGYCF